jgi:hypothetical protein
MSRSEDEFTDDPPPPRRPRRNDVDDENDYDVRLRPAHQLSGLDGTFANTHIVTLVLFSFCCGGIALILGIIGLCVCKDPRARQNALIVTIISGVFTVLGTIARVAAVMLQQ